MARVRLGEAALGYPAERMKMEAAHVVPLTDEVATILAQLPRFKKGDHLFSTTFGAKPVNGFSKAKELLDKKTLADLRSGAEHPEQIVLEPFVIHDIRRTMRTGLSALPIPDMVRELVIAHARPGLHQVYDQYSYVDEKRRALELWAARLRSIVDPPAGNVSPTAHSGSVMWSAPAMTHRKSSRPSYVGWISLIERFA